MTRFTINLHRFSSRSGKAWFMVLVALIMVLKFLLAALTPLGYDYVQYMSAILENVNFGAWSPWMLMTRCVYLFWLSLPIDHGNLLRAMLMDPKLLLPGHYLLAALVKTPLLVSDMASTFLIYKLATRLGGADTVARRATMLWLANPFTTLFVEMWGSIDIMPVTLGLVSIMFMIQGRVHRSAAAIAAGIALKISPIITWLALISWVHGRKPSKTVITDVFSLAVASVLGVTGYFYWLSQGRLLNLTVQDFLGLLASFYVSSYTPVTQTFAENFPFPDAYLWTTVMVLIAFYMLAAEIWPRGNRALISLALSGVLLMYALTDLSPPAFLWAIPLVALWHSKNGKLAYPLVFYVLLAVFLQTFYFSELTSTGLSFLFIPRNIIPMSHQLVAAAESLVLRQYLSLQIRSALSGAAFAYAACVAWTSLRKDRD
jgi:hypothetical protein